MQVKFGKWQWWLHLANILLFFFTVKIMGCIGACCALAVEIFFKTDESVIAIQRVFHAHCMLCQNDAVQDRKLLLL